MWTDEFFSLDGPVLAKRNIILDGAEHGLDGAEHGGRMTLNGRWAFFNEKKRILDGAEDVDG